MADDPDLESTTLAQRVVLLGVTHRTVCDDETPHSAEVRRTCGDLLADVRGDVVGEITEAEATRRLNELESGGFVEQVEIENPSPVGKGRPRYDLHVDADDLLGALEDDERVAPIVERIRIGKG